VVVEVLKEAPVAEAVEANLPVNHQEEEDNHLLYGINSLTLKHTRAYEKDIL
jgi:hypothetical protein